MAFEPADLEERKQFSHALRGQGSFWIMSWPWSLRVSPDLVYKTEEWDLPEPGFADFGSIVRWVLM